MPRRTPPSLAIHLATSALIGSLACSPDDAASGPSAASSRSNLAADPAGGVVDRTGEPGVAVFVRGENAQYGEVGINLIDDDAQTKWLDFEASSWIEIDFTSAGPGAFAIDTYALTSANDAPVRDPSFWTLSGSNDGQSWTTVDQRSGESFSQRHQTRTFSVSQPAAYAYYRLDVTNNAGSGWAPTQLAELELLETTGPAPVCGNGAAESGEACDDGNSNGQPGFCNNSCDGYVPNPVCGDGAAEGGEACDDGNSNGQPGFCNNTCDGYVPAPSMVDHTAAPGVGVQARGENSTYSEVASNLIDGRDDTKWLDYEPVTWIEIDFGSANPRVVTEYALTSANDEPSRDPEDWTLRGSTDGNTWTTLDARSGVVFTSRFQQRVFTFSNATAFRYYRLDTDTRAPSEGYPSWHPTQLAELQLRGPSGSNPPPSPVCGDGNVESGEVCDGDTRSCTTGGGYAGSQACNGSCSGYGACTSPSYCGDGVCDAGAETAGSCANDCAAQTGCGNGTIDQGEYCDSGAQNGQVGACNSTCTSREWRSGPPVYSGGSCPNLVNGLNSGFFVPNADPIYFSARNGQDVRYRDVEIYLPPNPIGAPVIFHFHWYNGSADGSANHIGLPNLAAQQGAIIVSPWAVAAPPVDDTGYFEWFTRGRATGNPDLELVEDLLGCLNSQFSVDLDRVYATGHSAGAQFTQYLLQHWSHRLAAAAGLSMGELYRPPYLPARDRLHPQFQAPARPLPTLVYWGGQNDEYYSPYHPTFSWDVAAPMLVSDLRASGSPTVSCEAGGGHTVPSTRNGQTVAEYLLWPYFSDHARDQGSYTSNADLPPSFPGGWCRVN